MSALKSRLEHILSQINELCKINEQLKHENSDLKKELSELKERKRQKGILPIGQKHSSISTNSINILIKEVEECVELVKKMA